MKTRIWLLFGVLSVACTGVTANERAIQPASTQRAIQPSDQQRAIDPPTQQRSSAREPLTDSPSTTGGGSSMDQRRSRFESDSRDLTDRIEQRRKDFEGD